MRPVLLSFVAGALLAIPAMPQSAELGISGGYGSLNDNSLSTDFIQDVSGSVEYSLSNGVRVGARMAFNPRAFIGHEISYAYQHAQLGYFESIEGSSYSEDVGAIRAHNMYYNMVAHATRTGSPVRPFVTGGGGFTSFFLPGVSSLSGGGNTKFGYNYGGGVKFNFSMYGFRLDVRNHVTGKPFGQFLPNVEGNLNNLEFSMTFSLLM